MRMDLMGDGGAGGLVARDAAAAEDGCHWYVVQAKAGADKAAEAHVRALGFDTYRPELERVVVRRGRKVVTVEPMFRSYLFARFHPLQDEWMRIGRHNYMCKVLMSGAPFYSPKPLPKGFVEQMRDSGLRFPAAEKDKPFQVGERVRVLDGPFRAFIARVSGLDDWVRVRVLLAFMGEQEVTFDVSQLEPA